MQDNSTKTASYRFYFLQRIWNHSSNCHKLYRIVLTVANDQLDGQFFHFIIRLLQSSTCFEQSRAHHQEVKLF